MTSAEVGAGAVAAHKRCTGRARAPSGSWQWVCGYLAPAGEGYALSAERHLAHHIALAIEADRAALVAHVAAMEDRRAAVCPECGASRVVDCGSCEGEQGELIVCDEPVTCPACDGRGAVLASLAAPEGARRPGDGGGGEP